MILTGEDSFPKVGRVHPERPWPGPKLVKVIQMLFRLLSIFLPAPLTLMLRTRQDSSISVAQIVVKYDGVDSGGGGGGKLVKKLSKS